MVSPLDEISSFGGLAASGAECSGSFVLQKWLLECTCILWCCKVRIGILAVRDITVTSIFDAIFLSCFGFLFG